MSAQALTSARCRPWLPDHLWAAVLYHLRPPDRDDICLFSAAGCQAAMEAQAEYMKLRLVCKQYNQIYNLQKPSTLSLFKHCDGDSLHSLLLWLQGCKTSLQVIETTCTSQCMESLLEAIANSPSSLQIVDTDGVSNRSVQLMAHCKLLTTCGLSEPSVTPLDVLPLQALPCLSSMVLQAGNFINFQPLAHLTSLRLRYSSVESAEDCMCASKLQKLDLYCSRIQIHHRGLSACQGLKALSCVEGRVPSEQDEDTLYTSFDTFQVSENLSAVTCLTQLAMQVPAIGEPDMSWLYSLKTLRDLQLSSTGFEEGLICTLLSHTLIQSLTNLQLVTNFYDYS